jgi:IS5 family transposase
VFHSVNDLVTAIEDYLKVNNDNPKPFVWTATAEQILAKVARGGSPSNKWKINNETLHSLLRPEKLGVLITLWGVCRATMTPWLDGIEVIVFRTVGDQPGLWESILPPELLVLPVELTRLDQLLDDPVFFAPFVPLFDPRRGRPSTPMETYLWLMF